jgi:ornithine cyclodeaminase/alanine dehydrogenase-like protein (mu-crystallin family)
VRYLTEDQVAALLPVDDAIVALEEAFRALGGGSAQVRPRQRVHLPGSVLQVMPAGLTTPSATGMGLKAYVSGRGGIHFVFLLFDPDDGRLLALMEANRLGQIRTGAASGLATKYLARDDAQTVGIFGAGWQARSQLAAVCAVRPIRQARCYSRDAGRREQFAREMAKLLGLTVTPAAEPAAVLDGADIIVTVTSAGEPVFDGAWLAPGTHINAAGINQAAKREIDSATVERAGIVVVDLLEQARTECGDLLAAERSGVFRWERAVELAAVVAGTLPGRSSGDEITLFESQGIALEDVAAGMLVYRRAVEQGVGVELPV